MVCFIFSNSLDNFMTLDEFVVLLEKDADPALVDAIKYWPTDTKLYMYLHNRQLSMMEDFMKILKRYEAKMD
jgi:hypothetical protein